jgi:hypothetical protein
MEEAVTRTRQAAATKVKDALELLDADYQQAKKDMVVMLAMEWREAEGKTLEFVRDRLASIGIHFNSAQALDQYHQNALRRANN